MLQIRGRAGGTALTGTLYEPDDSPPSFKGAPDEDAPYVWVCDAFYEVESGGTVQRIGDDEKRIAFESPMPRGFDDRDAAIQAAKEHVRTQFVRVGVAGDAVAIEIEADSG
jgi:hypothetical protein